MMNPKHALSERLASLQSWRHGLKTQADRIESALRISGFLSATVAGEIAAMQSRIGEERVTIGFVAEYSRGKSTLINALFFAEFGLCLLPSGSGKTTRCVTELRFDRQVKTGLKLLPIETRESPERFGSLFNDDSRWHTVPFEADNADSLAGALSALSETKRISIKEAVAWGLHGESIVTPATPAATPEADDIVGPFVDVPRWRYAIINFPHPLLDAGLVIIDAPGLAAFSTEPEVARERLLNADAILMVLDINRGVQKTDVVMWRNHLGALTSHSSARGDLRKSLETGEHNIVNAEQLRLVVLNKIDELPATLATTNDDRDVLREIDRRVRDAADLLRVDPIFVVPVSAKFGLAGAFEKDPDKAMKSRLYQLARRLAERLSTTRQDTQKTAILTTLSGFIETAQGELDQQRYQTLTGLSNLGVVRAKNEKMMVTIVEQTHAKQDRLEITFKELRGIKGVHGKLAEELAVVVNYAAAKKDLERAKDAIAASVLSGTVMESCNHYFAVAAEKLNVIEIKITEIRTLFNNIGDKIRKEFGLNSMEMFDAHPFATHRFQTELDRAREIATNEFGKTSNLLIRRGAALAEQFEDLVAGRVLNIFKIADRESSAWMRGLFNSLEKPLAELKNRMDQRSGSVDKIKIAELDLADRIAELQAEVDVIKYKHETLAEARAGLERFMGLPTDQGLA